METPFSFGKLATGSNFTNRSMEINHLKSNFLAGTNTILISPRRWGKSSLVEHVASQLSREEDHLRIIFLDLFNLRSEEVFLQKYAEAILKGTSTKLEEIMTTVKEFLLRCAPRISFSPDNQQELAIGFDWQGQIKQPDEVLDLPQKIAESKGQKLIICIDEFQNIGQYSDPEGLQKQLRSHWQRHQDVTYCLYGSKRNMMIQVFNSPSMPFYRFGDLVFLKKISSGDWEKFLTQRFRETGKQISSELAILLAGMVDNHPYYVQQLAQVCWLRSVQTVTVDILEESLESLILQMSLLFQGITESLSNGQVNFLEAVLHVEARLSSTDVIQRFGLGSSAHVSRSKKALIDKEIIDLQNGIIEFIDPLYRLWLERYYFQI